MRAVLVLAVVMQAGCVSARVPLDTWTFLQQKIPRKEWPDLAVPAVRVRDGKPIYIRASEATTDTDDVDRDENRTVKVVNGKLVVAVLLAIPSAIMLGAGAGVYVTPDPPPPMCPPSQFICGPLFGGNQFGGGMLMIIGAAAGVASIIVSVVGVLDRKTRLRPANADPKQLVRW